MHNYLYVIVYIKVIEEHKLKYLRLISLSQTKVIK
jgi:hypothetical protein